MNIAIRPIAGQRRRASAAIAAKRATTASLVRLVVERLDALATVGMVADRAGEQDDGAAVGADRPLVHAATGSASSIRANQSSPAAPGPRGCVVARRPGRPCVSR